ncbi:MAG TPA: peptidyl-prolyl cis-trans isomerase [Caulobacteraceae bacterium]|nr:peptidyl-prolyl cis-trans isomerase [Caulobacteraceae bacterium]
MRAAKEDAVAWIASLTAGKARRAGAPALAAACLAACGGPPSAQQPPEPGDQQVARVNGQAIWASDVKREAVAEGLIGSGDPLDTSSVLFHQVLDEVIDTRVLAAEALERHLDRDPLAQRRLAAARDRALEALMVESVVGKAVNARAEDALYKDFLKNRTPSEQVRLRQIVVATEPDAEAVKRELTAGAAFEAVAMERSIDGDSRFKGGDLGEATTDTLPQPIAEAIKGAKIGQVVGPVKVDAGWALLRVDERQPEPAPSLDQVRPQLIQFITYDQVKDLVLQLRSRSKVETLIGPAPDVPGAPTEPASAPANAMNSPPANAAGATTQ